MVKTRLTPPSSTSYPGRPRRLQPAASPSFRTVRADDREWNGFSTYRRGGRLARADRV